MSNTVIESPAIRAARGARLLDQHKPGWHDIVDATRIDINSSTNCVVAQAYGGSFDRGLTALEARTGRMIRLSEYGFIGRPLPDDPWSYDDKQLVAAWAKEIDARRSGLIRPRRTGFWRGLLRALAR